MTYREPRSGEEGPHTLYDAGNIARDYRMASWQKYFSHFWGPANVSAVSKTAFDATVESHQVGNLRLNKVRFKGQEIRRKSGYSELLDGSFHALNIVHKGEGTLTKGSTKTNVRAGDMLFSSSPKGNVFSVPGDFVATQLMIPTEVLSNYIPNTPEVILFHDRASSFKMSMLSCMLEQLTAAGASQEVDPDSARLIEKHILELLALAVEKEDCVPVSDETSVRFAHRLRIQRIIQENIGNAELSPGLISGLSGLSESYLHRIFNASGQSLMQTVRQLRLEKARDLLAADAQPRLSMGEIAYRCGFASHSSFTRSFHNHFGVSPKDMRRSL
ncbi:AraC family transcriptional regulator [Tropicimonas sp. TH_r6]|uniref:AraC family transcriptional regulator n=1 Tax=Tropicimonas sp. TH_r6 TaxID=3082085 RepID=UPI0029540848|nr:AraC family transcriptional regulator [Tropicimonas sp. TH_r6]MDV7143597.1 AraC family transcriptional regulator [Tropicimonas sp. TH_r6]